MTYLEEIKEYIQNKLPNLKQDSVDDRIYTFMEGDKEQILLIVSEKTVSEKGEEDRQMLFSKDFKLLLTDEELQTGASYFAFCFGGNFYYIKKKNLNDTKLHILRYLGKYEVDNSEFCHLGNHTCYSLLDGCQKIEFLIDKAKYLGFKSLGICERNSLSSVLKFQKACKKANIKSILGEEVVVNLNNQDYIFKLYAKNKKGWKNLINISNIINAFNRQEGNNYISENDLKEYLEDLVIVLPNNYPFDDKSVNFYSKYDTYYQIDTVEIINQDIYFDYLQNIKNYIQKYKSKIPPVLISDSYYLDEEDKKIQQILNKIGGEEYKVATKSQHFKSIEEHIEIFIQFWKGKEDKFDEFFSESIENTMKISDKCDLNIVFEKLHLPVAKIDGISQKENLTYFEQLIRKGMDKHGFTGIKEYEDRVKEEYDVIVGADLENYFLIIWDILHWCDKNNILRGLARGSAAGSLIMYLLDIVKINPFDYNLLFSRFLNAGRVAQIYYNFIFDDEKTTEIYKHISRLEIPEKGDRIAAKYFVGDKLDGHIINDIEIIYEGHISLPDVDMDVEDRERVKKFIITKYGEEQFALLGSYNTFKIKAAIKDLTRVMGSNLDYSAINILTSTLFFKEGVDAFFEEVFKTALNNSFFYSFVQENQALINAMYWILDTPKSASVHPCGTLSIPSKENIFDDFPLICQKGEYMVEWDGKELDELGFVKNDLLGLSQLEFFQNILSLIRKKKGEELDIYNLPTDDQSVFESFQQGWNSEVFQFNSYLLVNYCKLLKPNKIDDLIASVALVRPGPLNSGLHYKYAKRKEGQEVIESKFGYSQFTNDTYQIMVYQEQLMQIASYLGDLDLVETDVLRKALGKKDMDKMLEFKDKIKPKAISKGCKKDEFEEIWSEMVEFAKYAFNKSHAAAYALMGYISQYLKVYYPLEFWTSAFEKANNDQKRKEKFNQYFSELRDSKSTIKIVSPEINTSSNKTEFEEENIYFPLNNIKYLSNEGVENIIASRNKEGNYYSFEEFLIRLCGKEKILDKRELENLILSGAFDKVEDIKISIDRDRLIKKLYIYLKKDYQRDFLVDSFQKNNLWWKLKQWELVGVTDIDYNKICSKYFDRYAYVGSLSSIEEGQKVNFGGIIIDYVERKTKKQSTFGNVVIEYNNIPYNLLLWSEAWEKYKDSFVKYKNQIVLFEGVFSKNPKTEQFQLNLVEDSEPMFLGSSEETKLEKPKAIGVGKFDIVKLDTGEIGTLIKYPSNAEISIELEDKTIKVVTKWEIVEVIEKFKKD